MNISCRVVRTRDKGALWTLPSEILEQLKLKENDDVTLRCGSASATARIGRLKLSMSGAAGLSTKLFRTLGIPPGVTLLVKPEDNKAFRLGPVIGVLTFSSIIAEQKLFYYSTQAILNRNNGIYFVFSGRDLNPRNRTVRGYYYDHQENYWKPGAFPFPDVVIDRCYPNVDAYHSILEKVIGARIFNRKSRINKLEFYQTLHRDPLLRKHIPETRPLKNTWELDLFMQKYREVFLKPDNSMKGKGIVTAKSLPGGLLACRYVKDGRDIVRGVPAGKIFGLLESAAGRKRSYIIQQAIPRMEYGGGPFSFRTWAMKNSEGRWVMPGMFAKGAFGGGFLTNFTAGASLVPLKELFADILPRLACTEDQLVSRLEGFTLKTAVALDKNFGPLGELGLDIVFDTAGKLWLIEANGNPGKIPIFMQTEYPAWRHLVYQYPLAYATHLAGFEPGSI